MSPIKLARQSVVPLPRLKAYRLSGKIGLDSSHQSSRFLKMCSTTLQSEEDKAIGRKELFDLAFGMEITLYLVQDKWIKLKSIKLLSILSKSSNALVGRCFNIRGDIQSMPEAADLREKIAVLYYYK